MDTAQSIETAILARARPHMLAAKAKAILREEVSKGCRPEIAPHPVALEPNYRPIFDLKEVPASSNSMLWVPERIDPSGAVSRRKTSASRRLAARSLNLVGSGRPYFAKFLGVAEVLRCCPSTSRKRITQFPRFLSK